MYRHFGLLILCITPFLSFSQEEKGCGVSNNFSVVYGQTVGGNANSIMYCSSSYGLFCAQDSIFIELDLDEDVTMKWTFKDELMLGYASVFESPIEWYRNDSLIDISEIIIDEYVGPGNCGTQQKVSAILATQILGAYQLRKTHSAASTPIIVLREKAAVIEEVEEISLNIYPNPSSDVLYIEHGEVNNTEIILYSIDGKIITRPMLKSSGGITEIDTSHLPSGSYILTFSSDQHQTVREKITLI